MMGYIQMVTMTTEVPVPPKQPICRTHQEAFLTSAQCHVFDFSQNSCDIRLKEEERDTMKLA